MKIGDRVKFNRRFLASVQWPEGKGFHGIIQNIIPAEHKGATVVPARAKVKWNDDSESSALITNLQMG